MSGRIRFNCGVCGASTTQPYSEYTRNAHHYCSQRCSGLALAASKPPAQPRVTRVRKPSTMTPRVEAALLSGAQYKRIPEALDIPIHTFKWHARKIYHANGVASRVELLAKVLAQFRDQSTIALNSNS